MADFDERQSMLAEEDEEPVTHRQTAGGPGKALPAICDPSHLLHRLVVLVFMCFLGFGELTFSSEGDSLLCSCGVTLVNILKTFLQAVGTFCLPLHINFEE